MNSLIYQLMMNHFLFHFCRRIYYPTSVWTLIIFKNEENLPHDPEVQLHDASDEYLIDLVLAVIQSIDYNDVTVHDAMMITAAHMDQHLNILFLKKIVFFCCCCSILRKHSVWKKINKFYHDFVAVADFVSYDEMVAENMEVENLIVTLDDALMVMDRVHLYVHHCYCHYHRYDLLLPFGHYCYGLCAYYKLDYHLTNQFRYGLSNVPISGI